MNKVVVFPTDTVYGIGAALHDTKAINRIYQIKGRSYDKPLIVLAHSLSDVQSIAVVTKEAAMLADAFWPGALTMILKTKTGYEKKYGEKTIGVRIPNHPTALKAIDKYGYGLLKTTSVNHSGMEPLNDYDKIVSTFGLLVDEVYPNTYHLSQHASTIIDLTHDEMIVLREGDITLKQLKDAIDQRVSNQLFAHYPVIDYPYIEQTYTHDDPTKRIMTIEAFENKILTFPIEKISLDEYLEIFEFNHKEEIDKFKESHHWYVFNLTSFNIHDDDLYGIFKYTDTKTHKLVSIFVAAKEGFISDYHMTISADKDSNDILNRVNKLFE